MKALVIGGTLFIGRELVRQLLAAGHDVTVLHRSAGRALYEGVEEIIGDRNDGDSMRRLLGGRDFELVFDNVYDWQRGTTAEHVEAAASACGGRLERYVFMSSVASYGEGLELSEVAPLAPGDHPESYVRNKAGSERALFRMHQEKGFPVVTLRPPYVYGPGNPFYREAFFWDRFSAGRPVIVPGDGSRLMQFVYVKDLARACLLASQRPEAIGRGFNIAHPAPITQESLVRALARAAGVEPRLVHVPRERIESARGSVFGPDNLYFGVYYDLPPITQKIDAARELLGFEPAGFETALGESYAWYKEHHQPPDADYEFEDALLDPGG